MVTKKKRSEESIWGQPAVRDLETWYKQTVTRLYRFVYSKLQNHEEAEDITQETYARCLKTYHSKQELPPFPYLKEAARNLIYDRFRRSRVQPTVFFSQDMTDETIVEEDLSTASHIQDLLYMLSIDQRVVLQLRIVEGYSRRETAERMGRSEDAVRGLQYRAIQALREVMRNAKEE